MLDDLTADIRAFADEREWARFHTPKNLVLALAGEVGELAAEFQWLTVDEAQGAADPGDLRDRVAAEIADVGIYLLRLCDILGVDFEDAVRAKLTANAQRYTVEKSRGNAEKR